MKQQAYIKSDKFPSRVYCRGCKQYTPGDMPWIYQGTRMSSPPWNLEGFHCPTCGYSNAFVFEWDDGAPLPHCGDPKCIGKCADPDCLPTAVDTPKGQSITAKYPNKTLLLSAAALIIYSIAVTIYVMYHCGG